MANREDRAVSTLIGFILLFGILIVSFSIYQGFVVPEQNRGVEFRHNQKVQGELLNLQDAIRLTGTTGVSQSTSITVGADYPERTLAVNFGLTGGRIRTTKPTAGGANNITFGNVTAVSSEVEDYWNSSTSTLAFRTKDIVYTPTYSRYQSAPDTVLSNTAAFKEFDDANLSIADQILVQGNRITVVAINGSLDKAVSGEGSSISVGTEALSVASRSISIRNNSGRINLTIPTRIDEIDVWNQSSLTDEYDPSGQIHTVTRPNRNHVSIILNNDTYTLRMMKVGIGSGATDPDAEYITDVDTPKSVADETTAKLIYEVRDGFNNPENGVSVEAEITDGVDSTNETSGSPTEEISPEDESETALDGSGFVDATTSDGRVVFEYSAPNVTKRGTVDIQVTFGSSPDAKETVTTTFTVFDTDGGGGSDSGSTSGDGSADETNPKDGDIILTGDSVTSDNDASATIQNSGSARTITEIRVPFYYDGKVQGNGPGVTDVEAIKNGIGGSDIHTGPTSIPTGTLNVTVPLGSSSSLTLEFDFDEDVNNGGNGEDFFMFTLVFDNGEVATFMIAPG
jgi:hypothetical protein